MTRTGLQHQRRSDGQTMLEDPSRKFAIKTAVLSNCAPTPSPSYVVRGEQDASRWDESATKAWIKIVCQKFKIRIKLIFVAAGGALGTSRLLGLG